MNADEAAQINHSLRLFNITTALQLTTCPDARIKLLKALNEEIAARWREINAEAA